MAQTVLKIFPSYPSLFFNRLSALQKKTSVVVDRAERTENKRLKFSCLKNLLGFPGGAVLESLPADAGDTGSSPGLGGSHMPWSN